jgi:large subunit ribosomal protein L22
MKMAEKKLEKKQAKATIKMLRGSPQKLNLVAESIRGLSAQKAIEQLTFSKKGTAPEVRKLVLSAIANAENNLGMDADKLFVAEAWVGKALVMKRFHARARGRGASILKPYSNITIVVEERAETREKKPAKKEAKTKANKTTTARAADKKEAK